MKKIKLFIAALAFCAIAKSSFGQDSRILIGLDDPALDQIECYVKANKHLPEIPSAKQIQAEGLDLAEMNLLLLKKMEEMTLHMIQLNNTVIKQSEEIKTQANQIKSLQKENKK